MNTFTSFSSNMCNKMDQLKIRNKQWYILFYGGISIMLIMCTVLLIANSMQNNTHPINKILNGTFHFDNECIQYKLIKDRLRISLCIGSPMNTTHLDIREYSQNSPSIKGVTLSKLEFLDFMTYIPLIDWSVRNGQAV